MSRENMFWCPRFEKFSRDTASLPANMFWCQRFIPKEHEQPSEGELCPTFLKFRAAYSHGGLHGYLAHKKTPPPRTLK